MSVVVEFDEAVEHAGVVLLRRTRGIVQNGVRLVQVGLGRGVLADGSLPIGDAAAALALGAATVVDGVLIYKAYKKKKKDDADARDRDERGRQSHRKTLCDNIYKAYKAACGLPRNCNAGMSCGEIEARAKAGMACVGGRASYMALCSEFDRGTRDHQGQLNDARKALANCEALSSAKGCRETCPLKAEPLGVQNCGLTMTNNEENIDDRQGRKKILREKIVSAFAEVEYPGDSFLVDMNPHGFNHEQEDLLNAFRGKHWRDLTLKELHNTGLFFFTPQGFHYFLPAYLIVSIEDYEDADVLPFETISSLQSELSAESGRTDKFERTVRLFTPSQREAIREFLMYMRDEHSAESYHSRGELDRLIEFYKN